MKSENKFMKFVETVRGKAPEGMPGAERFSASYDGPMPKGRTKDDLPKGFAGSASWSADDRMDPAFIESVRGKAPEGMPGAERFADDYDGTIPER